jgi:hypothetical protein
MNKTKRECPQNQGQFGEGGGEWLEWWITLTPNMPLSTSWSKLSNMIQSANTELIIPFVRPRAQGSVLPIALCHFLFEPAQRQRQGEAQGGHVSAGAVFYCSTSQAHQVNPALLCGALTHCGLPSPPQLHHFTSRSRPNHPRQLSVFVFLFSHAKSLVSDELTGHYVRL